MSPETITSVPPRYAALGRRFHAYRFDLFLCLGVFVVGGSICGIFFENHPAARIAAFLLILAFILGYEPFMVARYGGTFGHRRANIRISCARTDANLPFWRAAVRSLTKQIFGIFSFAFMFVTHRAQGIHDAIAGATVNIRDPRAADPGDYFYPKPELVGEPASAIRRILITVLYNLLLVVIVGGVISLTVSSACVSQNSCGAAEDLTLSIAGGGWLILCLVSIILGWTGRLPGCRHKSER